MFSQKFAETPFILTTQPVVIYLLREKNSIGSTLTHGQPYDIYVAGVKYSQLLQMGQQYDEPGSEIQYYRGMLFPNLLILILGPLYLDISYLKTKTSETSPTLVDQPGEGKDLLDIFAG